MTGNIALDVFIGLAFIYLLYSLYATVIVEIITSIFRLRSKNLQYAIKRMLTDDEKSALRDWIQGIAKFKVPEKWSKKKEQTFLDKFFNQSTIKYLSKSGFIWERRPSYIAPHSFSKAILDILKNEGTGDTIINKVSTGIDNCPIDENTRKHIKSLLEDANNDLQKFKLLIEQWFNDTMERSIGWFKRNNQLILFIIGLFIAITFNVNTIHIAKLLSKDNNAREQMVAIAINDKDKYLDLISNIKDTTKDSNSLKKDYQKHIDTLNKVKNELKNDIKKTEIVFGGGWNLPKNIEYKEEVEQIRIKELNSDKYYNIPLSYNKIPESDSLKKIARLYYIDINLYNKCFKLDSVHAEPLDINRVERDTIFKIYDKKEIYKVKTTIYYVFDSFKYKRKYARKNFLGYLLTALAISLGSPFWFDLLNKLVKLRGSVRQAVTSEESTTKTSNPKQNTSDNPLNRKG